MARQELSKLICSECGKAMAHCVCESPAKQRAVMVRVFTEAEVREAAERLDAGEPLAALDYLRELLDGGKQREPTRRRL